LLFAALAACGGTPDDTTDAGPLLDAGDGDFQIARVGFVNLIEGSGFLGVYALLQDRPELPVAAAIAQEAECTVFRRPAPSLCDPPCSEGVCTAPDTCTPYAQQASAGPITVTGLRVPLSFEPGPFGYSPTPQPPNDLFAPGATLVVSAPGDVTPAFSATVTAPSPLEAPFQNVTLVDGVDTTITWTAGDGGPRSIQLMFVVGWHGAPAEALLVCETDDDGSHTIPGSLISSLPRASSGLEQHNSWILRFDRSIVAAPAGPIEVVTGSQVFLYFSHP
jgi:hypothetical protein